MSKIVFLIAVNLYLFANPYKEVSAEEKINIFTNYFLNNKIKEELPQKPKQEEVDTGKYNYSATKYELNYNYVQRIKAIKESIAEEQSKLDDKYDAEVYKYYNKLKKLYQKYQDKSNRMAGVQEAFNKALKTVYGKPIIKIKEIGGLKKFFLDVENIYQLHDFNPKEIQFGVVAKTKLLQVYHQCEVHVRFTYKNENISYDEVICQYKDRIYKGKTLHQDNEKIKLKIKINDDIFQKILKDTN